MNATQVAADAAWMVALVICLAIALACAVGIAAIVAWQARHLYGLVTDRLEAARMRHTIRRIAARNPFDDLARRAADADRSLTANYAIDDDEPAIETTPGSDRDLLNNLNRLYDAPSWEGK